MSSYTSETIQSFLVSVSILSKVVKWLNPRLTYILGGVFLIESVMPDYFKVDLGNHPEVILFVSGALLFVSGVSEITYRRKYRRAKRDMERHLDQLDELLDREKDWDE